MAEVKFTIWAEDKATAVVRAVHDALGGMKEKLSSAFDYLKTSYFNVSMAVKDALGNIQKAWRLAEMYAGFQEQKDSLNALAAQYGTTADSIIADIKRAAGGMVSLSDAVSVAAGTMKDRMMTPEMLTNLAGAAETLSNLVGGKVANNFRSMAEAVALGRERALEASVGIIDLNAKYGDQVAKMTDVEKAQARYGIVMEKVKGLQEKLGESTVSMSDRMEKFGVTIEDVKIKAGEYLVRAFFFVHAVFEKTASIALYLSSAIFKVVQGVSWLAGARETARSFGEDAAAAFGAAKKLGEDAAASWKMMKSDLNAAAKANQDYAAAVRQVTVNEEQRQARIKQAAADLKGVLSSWQSYYGQLKAAHEKALNEMEAKTKAFEEHQKLVVQQRLEYEDILRGLRQKTMTDEEKYYDDKGALEAEYNRALLMGRQEQIKALEEWQKKRAAMVDKAAQYEYLAVDEMYRMGDAITQATREIAAAEEVKRATQDALTAQYQADMAALESWVSALAAGMTNAQNNIAYLKQTIDDLNLALKDQRILDVDTSAAVDSVKYLKDQIDAIPDISHKTVIIHYKTQASPIMPFSEGIRHIKSMMESLPERGQYVAAFGNQARGSGGAQAGGSVTIAPTIHINGAGGDAKSLAKSIDRELTSLWKYRRSNLRAVMAR